MKDKMIINVACAADDNFAQHLCVTLLSLVKNLSNGRTVNIIILDGGIVEKNINRIKNSLRGYKNKITSLKFVKIDDFDFLKYKVSKNLSRAAYFRINLPDLLPYLDKIIYFDSDLVVDGDVSELFDESFDGKYLIAVRDHSLEMEFEYSSKFHIPNIIGYFNSGVLVIDLKAFRENAITEKVFESMSRINELTTTPDQTSLNDVLYDKWKATSPKWNQLAGVSIEKNYKKTTYSKSDFLEAKNNPKIIHYSSPFSKPWKFECISPHKDKYFYYLSLTEFNQYKVDINFKKLLLKALFLIYFIYTPNVIKKFIFNVANLVKLYKQ